MNPPITIVMSLFIPPTEGGFSRLQAAKQTLLSWGRHMKYAGPLRVCIANDSSDLPDGQVGGDAPDALIRFSPFDTVVLNTRASGLGGAFNAGMREAFEHSDLALYADDSYSLVEDIDLTPWAQVLLQHEIGAVSLMPPRPDVSGGRCAYFHNLRTEGVAGMIFPHEGYIWNGRPLLYHKRFFDAYGWTKEHCSGYEWENDGTDRYNALPSGPDVLFGFIDPWQHVWGGVRLGDKEPGWKG